MNYFSLLVFVFATSVCFSQNLSIELSIVWEKEANYLNIDSLKEKDTLLLPYLCITYRNNGKSDIYFKKPLGDELYPSFPSISPYHDKNFLETGNPTIGSWDFSKNEIYAIISNDMYLYSTWSALDTNHIKLIEYNKPIETPTIYEIALGNIYSLLSLQESLDRKNTGKQLMYFSYPEKEAISYRDALELIRSIENKNSITHFNKEILENEDVLDEYEDHFLFLKQHETFTHRKSLIGFMIIKGNFKFSIDTNVFSNIIKLSIDNEKFHGIKEYTLPLEVGGYELYTKYFMTNSVGVKF